MELPRCISKTKEMFEKSIEEALESELIVFPETALIQSERIRRLGFMIFMKQVKKRYVSILNWNNS